MKSLLSIIGVKEFEKAAAKATRRAAKATLAVGGSYLGMVGSEIVRVEGQSSKTSKGSLSAKAVAGTVQRHSNPKAKATKPTRAPAATSVTVVVAERLVGLGVKGKSSRGAVRVIEVAAPATKQSINRALKAEKPPLAVVKTLSKKRLSHG